MDTKGQTNVSFCRFSRLPLPNYHISAKHKLGYYTSSFSHTHIITRPFVKVSFKNELNIFSRKIEVTEHFASGMVYDGILFVQEIV